LFSQVLKDLARALDTGRKVNLFRQDAFDTSLEIIEIETILKQATNRDTPLAGKFRMPTGHKILWLFKKSKVEFFRRLLDSLKSTILMELAVLNYAMKITKHSA
jgi:hypothetical protein